MKTHLIKILEDHYDLVLAGTKTFEIRLNDRAYQKGDYVEMTPIYRDLKTVMHHRQVLKFKIGDVYPVDSERVVFSLLKAEVASE